MSFDPYHVLGVPKNASTKVIKKAFRRIARECHPDVSGNDPEKAETFKTAKRAYELLIDPASRAKHDRRGQRRPGGGSFFDAFYRATGERSEADARRDERRSRRVRNADNNLDLEDLFAGFGGGTGSSSSGAPGASGRHQGPQPLPGDDVYIGLDVPAQVAKRGGSVTATYNRLQRIDSWQPGSSDPGLIQVTDLTDVRVLPGTFDGQVLRERGLGDAGAYGGIYGDLVVTVRVVGAGASQAEEAPQETVVPISVAEALLGASIKITTPTGRVRLTVPPGSASGTKLRLRGRGVATALGAPTDLVVTLRVVLPTTLDATSKELIEAFGKRNPPPKRD